MWWRADSEQEEPGRGPNERLGKGGRKVGRFGVSRGQGETSRGTMEGGECLEGREMCGHHEGRIRWSKRNTLLTKVVDR